MADKKQINPKLSLLLHTRFLGYCQEKDQAQSDVVEAALTAFLAPPTVDTGMGIIVEQVRTLHDQLQAQHAQLCDVDAAMAQIIALLKTVVEKLPTAAPPPPPVASNAVLYPERRDERPVPAFQTSDAPAEALPSTAVEQAPVQPALIVKPAKRWRLWG